MSFTNPTGETIAVRDDTGKHLVEPGSTIEIHGDQHAPAWVAAGLVSGQAAPDVPRGKQGGKGPAKDPEAS